MKKVLLPILIILVAVVGFWKLKSSKAVKPPVEIEEKAWVVATTTVQPASLSPTVMLYGQVESPQVATIRTPTLSTATEVNKIDTLEGMSVKKNQVLIYLDTRDSELNLAQQEADINEIDAQITLENQRHAYNKNAIEHERKLLQLTEKAVERMRQLKNKRVGSQSSLDEAQQALEKQKLSVANRDNEIKQHTTRLAQLKAMRQRTVARRDIAKLELARTKIKAPFDGKIVKVNVSQGDRVRSGDTLLSLYDTSTLEIRAQMPNRYQDIVLTAFNNKQELTAFETQRDIKLTLNRLSGEINPKNGGIDGLFQITQGMEKLRLGEFLTVYLELPAQANVIALPFEAIYGTNRVYKVIKEEREIEKQKVTETRMKSVSITHIGDTYQEEQILALIRSDELQTNDEVIITQLPNAVDGLKVKQLAMSTQTGE